MMTDLSYGLEHMSHVMRKPAFAYAKQRHRSADSRYEPRHEKTGFLHM